MSIFVDFVSSYAFYGCSKLTGPMTFSSNLFEVGDYAFFGCSSLNGKLHLGFGLKRVGSFAFFQCSRLTGSLILGYRKFGYYYSNIYPDDKESFRKAPSIRKVNPRLRFGSTQKSEMK